MHVDCSTVVYCIDTVNIHNGYMPLTGQELFTYNLISTLFSLTEANAKELEQSKTGTVFIIMCGAFF